MIRIRRLDLVVHEFPAEVPFTDEQLLVYSLVSTGQLPINNLIINVIVNTAREDDLLKSNKNGPVELYHIVIYDHFMLCLHVYMHT